MVTFGGFWSSGESVGLHDRIWCWSLPRHGCSSFDEKVLLEPPIFHGSKNRVLIMWFSLETNLGVPWFSLETSRKSMGFCRISETPTSWALDFWIRRSWSEDCKISPMQLGGKGDGCYIYGCVSLLLWGRATYQSFAIIWEKSLWHLCCVLLLVLMIYCVLWSWYISWILWLYVIVIISVLELHILLQ